MVRSDYLDDEVEIILNNSPHNAFGFKLPNNTMKKLTRER